jgi:predicted XRE-type DNA-binding protein
MTRESIGIYEGDANIFAELGLPAAGVHFLKAQIVAELCRCTTERKLTEAKVAELLGVAAPDVGGLFKGKFREYSVEQLFSFLTAFNLDVEIVTRPSSTAGRGEVRFNPAA